MSRQQYITLEAAGQSFPKKISQRAVKSLILRGTNGIRLRAIFDGYRYFTTPEWVEEYLQAQSGQRLGVQPEPRAVQWDQVKQCL